MTFSPSLSLKDPLKNSPTSLEVNLLINKEEMLTYIKSHPEDFNELLELSLADKQAYSWRAAWLLWKIMKKNDLRIQPHLFHYLFFLKQMPFL